MFIVQSVSLLPQVLTALLFAVQPEAAGMKSNSCRLLFFPDAANLMADGNMFRRC